MQGLGAVKLNFLVGVITSIAVASAVAAATPVVADLLANGEPRRVTRVEPDVQRTIPALTADQRNKIASVIMTDSRVLGLLPSSVRNALSPSGIEIVSWTDSAGNIIGGVGTVRFEAPVDLSGEWLGLRWVGQRPGASKPYESFRFQAPFTGVPGLRAFVDLRDGQVVSISPEKGATLAGDIRPIDPIPAAPRESD